MPGPWARQFSTAAWLSGWLPPPLPTQTTCGWVLGIRERARKPSWRSLPTVLPGASSSIAILTVLPVIAALAYWPISLPATELSVANRASAASTGSVGLSRAMTSTPSERASSIAAVTPAETGVIRIASAPMLTMFSSAVMWPAASSLALPAPVTSTAPFARASLWAPSRILTKNGLASVLVINPMMIGLGDDAAVVVPELPPQPTIASMAAPATNADHRHPPRRVPSARPPPAALPVASDPMSYLRMQAGPNLELERSGNVTNASISNVNAQYVFKTA